MGFQQGLSGLNSSSRALDVIGNNIANASTVGFKAANTHFADVFANQMAGGASFGQVGIGSMVAAVQQGFNQGNVTSTNNPLEIAINGNGFFRMSYNGAISYTRNGQFHLDKSGYIIDDRYRNLTGYIADTTGTIVQASPGPIRLDPSDQPPLATGSGVGAFQGVRMNVNLDSREPEKTWVGANQGPVPARDTIWTPPTTAYNWSSPVAIYDSLGNAHSMTVFAVKTPNPREWEIHLTVDGTNDANVALGTSILQFDTNGRLTNGTGIVGVSVDLNQVMADRGGLNNAETPLAFEIDFTNSTQFGAIFSNNRIEQDGYASGRLTGLNVSAEGLVQGSYSNGQTRNLGQVVLTSFTNPNGLIAVGGNQWVESADSGPPMVGIPKSSTLGTLQPSSVEESTTDMTKELVEMITQQRNYQANAQTVKTQDQIMQTIVNLR